MIEKLDVHVKQTLNKYKLHKGNKAFTSPYATKACKAFGNKQQKGSRYGNCTPLGVNAQNLWPPQLSELLAPVRRTHRQPECLKWFYSQTVNLSLVPSGKA